MPAEINIRSQRFGRLLVIEPTWESIGRRRRRQWWCLCDCGSQLSVKADNLKSGNTKSCGCLQSEAAKETCRKYRRIHGKTRSRTYVTWNQMKARCTNPSHHAWVDYGGRGIVVCERWQRFENFYADMGDRPSGRTSLDRIDNNGNYEPGNCRWATSKDQARNRRVIRRLTLAGRTQILSDWATEYNIDRATLGGRLRRGLTLEKALTMPVKTKHVGRSRRVSYKQRLAQCLKLLIRADGSPLIPVEMHDKAPEDILKLVQWDHVVPLALGGKDGSSNLQPLTIADHKEKTKRDIATIAKSRRLTKAQEEFRQRILAKVGIEDKDAERVAEEKRTVLGLRGPRPQRKMKGRGFQGWRTFSGEIRWKKDKQKRSKK